jgi:hypothetical protein
MKEMCSKNAPKEDVRTYIIKITTVNQILSYSSAYYSILVRIDDI